MTSEAPEGDGQPESTPSPAWPPPWEQPAPPTPPGASASWPPPSFPPPEWPGGTPPPRHRPAGRLLLVLVVLAAALMGVMIGRASVSTPHNAALLPGVGGSDRSGVGAGGGSLRAGPIASKVDPGVVDINVVLGYADSAAAGTGIVVTRSGLVYTNNHIVEGATTIDATEVSTGRTYVAKVIGTDPSADVAVLQLERAHDLATVVLGNSRRLRTGMPVLAIGNAGGTGGLPSTAAGSVVALHRSITASDESGANSERLNGLVESTAPIEPGDSGGPLVSSDGKVLAMDTAAAPGQHGQGTFAFSIPIDRVASIAGRIEHGASSSTIEIGSRGIMGIGVENAKGPKHHGALVVTVVAGSPAAKAGFVAGDVVLRVNGVRVGSAIGLTRAMAHYRPGARVLVRYTTRTGALRSVSLVLVPGPPG